MARNAHMCMISVHNTAQNGCENLLSYTGRGDKINNFYVQLIRF